MYETGAHRAQRPSADPRLLDRGHRRCGARRSRCGGRQGVRPDRLRPRPLPHRRQWRQRDRSAAGYGACPQPRQLLHRRSACAHRRQVDRLEGRLRGATPDRPHCRCPCSRRARQQPLGTTRTRSSRRLHSRHQGPVADADASPSSTVPLKSTGRLSVITDHDGVDGVCCTPAVCGYEAIVARAGHGHVHPGRGSSRRTPRSRPTRADREMHQRTACTSCVKRSRK